MRRLPGRDELAPIRREAADAAAGLGLGGSFGLDELLDAVSAGRGRPIDIQAVRGLGAGQVTALWLSLPEVELILHAETESELYREQVILHELAHMVLGHDVLDGESSAVHSLLPDLSGALVRGALARCHERSHREVAAELLADLLATGLSGSRRRPHREPLNFEAVFG
jgi:hypothetical protein